MDGLTRQDVIDAVRSLQADDIPMLLPGVAVHATATDAAPVNETRLFRFADGRYSLAEES